MILRFKDSKGYHEYPTEKAVVAEEVASLRKDDKIKAAWLNGRRIK